MRGVLVDSWLRSGDQCRSMRSSAANHSGSKTARRGLAPDTTNGQAASPTAHGLAAGFAGREFRAGISRALSISVMVTGHNAGTGIHVGVSVSVADGVTVGTGVGDGIGVGVSEGVGEGMVVHRVAVAGEFASDGIRRGNYRCRQIRVNALARSDCGACSRICCCHVSLVVGRSACSRCLKCLTRSLRDLDFTLLAEKAQRLVTPRAEEKRQLPRWSPTECANDPTGVSIGEEFWLALTMMKVVIYRV